MKRSFACGDSQKACAICNEELHKSGALQGILVAECFHSFHSSCVQNNVKHGNLRCPVCNCIWKITPLILKVPKLSRFSTGPSGTSHLDGFDFHDDEPLSVPLPSTSATGHEKVVVKTFTEFPAVAASDSISEFAVLLDVRGPPLLIGDGQSRVPVDLVFVLDVSGSMFGTKLSLLKSATRFVIDRMLPCDRLSIVAFATSASRILPLRRMTEEGRQAAKLAVDELRADDLTNIVAGLNMGAKVLEERRECNPVSSIILVSDGQDTVQGGRAHSNASGSDPPAYLNLLASSIFCGNRDTFGVNEHSARQRFPVHAFGVGMNHDAVAMNAISDASGGTFSFIESAEIIPTSFARCIGGLFSVVAQDVRLTVWSASPGVEIKAIPSGRHESEINSEKNQGTIHVGDLYAEEKKDFLVYVSVPVYSETKMEEEGIVGKTPLLDIVCYYRNPLSNETEQVEVKSVEIPRPCVLTSADGSVNLEVDRQKNRVRVMKHIQKAKELAEKGNMMAAQKVLSSTRATLLASASAKSGDDLANQLEAELREITARMANMGLYQQSGRPLVLAGLSAHNSQRATTMSHTHTQRVMMTQQRLQQAMRMQQVQPQLQLLLQQVQPQQPQLPQQQVQRQQPQQQMQQVQLLQPQQQMRVAQSGAMLMGQQLQQAIRMQQGQQQQQQQMLVAQPGMMMQMQSQQSSMLRQQVQQQLRRVVQQGMMMPQGAGSPALSAGSVCGAAPSAYDTPMMRMLVSEADSATSGAMKQE